MMLDFENITNKYFAKFLGIDKVIFNNGINIFFNSELDNTLRGYSYPIDIYIIIKNDTINISYGNKSKRLISPLEGVLSNNKGIEYIKNKVLEIYPFKIKHNLKYVYRNIIKSKNTSTILTEEDIELFLEFFKKTNLNCQDYSWVNEYFYKLVKKNYCHGIIVNGILISVTDAPDMPYMGDIVQEIGIRTLDEYQRKGYAKMACISMIETLIEKNICPIWSTGIENIGSDRLAKSIGFENYLDVLALSMI